MSTGGVAAFYRYSRARGEVSERLLVVLVRRWALGVISVTIMLVVRLPILV